MSKILVKEGDKEEINGEISGEIGERAKDFEDGAINALVSDTRYFLSRWHSTLDIVL